MIRIRHKTYIIATLTIFPLCVLVKGLIYSVNLYEMGDIISDYGLGLSGVSIAYLLIGFIRGKTVTLGNDE